MDSPHKNKKRRFNLVYQLLFGDLTPPKLLSVIFAVILVDVVLSGDNGVVIGSIVSSLEARERRIAIFIGMVGAVAMRAGMIYGYRLIAGNVPVKLGFAGYLILLGGITLLGVKNPIEWLLEKIMPRSAAQLSTAIILVMVNDAAFSADNVLAIVAFTDHFMILVIGVAASILLLAIAAEYYARLIRWEPWINHGVGLLIMAIGAELVYQTRGGSLPEWVNLVVLGAILSATIIAARIYRAFRQ